MLLHENVIQNRRCGLRTNGATDFESTKESLRAFSRCSGSSELYLSLGSKIVLTVQYGRTYYIEDGQAFFTRPNFAGWAACPVSVRLSRSERARHLRGGRRPARFVHQSFSF